MYLRGHKNEKKVKMYEHFGMKMVREHIVSEKATYYEMVLSIAQEKIKKAILYLRRRKQKRVSMAACSKQSGC